MSCRPLPAHRTYPAQGTELLDSMGVLHKFMDWPRNLLTGGRTAKSREQYSLICPLVYADSGGFQMVSLLQLAEITEEGVTFSSPVDGTQMLLRPEDSIHHQNRIGSDIIMALDDVAPSTIEVQAPSFFPVLPFCRHLTFFAYRTQLVFVRPWSEPFAGLIGVLKHISVHTISTFLELSRSALLAQGTELCLRFA